MKKEEIEQLHIERAGFIFTPRTKCKEIILEDGSKDFDYTVISTAEEVYQEWVLQKNSKPLQTQEDRIAELEDLIAGVIGGAL